MLCLFWTIEPLVLSQIGRFCILGFLLTSWCCKIPDIMNNILLHLLFFILKISTSLKQAKHIQNLESLADTVKNLRDNRYSYVSNLNLECSSVRDNLVSVMNLNNQFFKGWAFYKRLIFYLDSFWENRILCWYGLGKFLSHRTTFGV